jgi:hypothetical protein
MRHRCKRHTKDEKIDGNELVAVDSEDYLSKLIRVKNICEFDILILSKIDLVNLQCFFRTYKRMCWNF